MSTMSSRSNSWASISSTTSSLSPMRSRYNPYDLEARAAKILTTLANQPKHAASVSQHISPHIKVEHGDDSPEYSLERYLSRFSNTLSRCPDCHLEIKEACVDEMQRKVWVQSEVTGYPNGIVKERVDMLSFDENGILVGSIDHHKVKRRW